MKNEQPLWLLDSCCWVFRQGQKCQRHCASLAGIHRHMGVCSVKPSKKAKSPKHEAAKQRDNRYGGKINAALSRPKATKDRVQVATCKNKDAGYAREKSEERDNADDVVADRLRTPVFDRRL